VDGEFGLFSRQGVSSFDRARVRTNDPAFASPATMLAAAAPVSAGTVVELDASDLDSLVQAAISQWEDALGADDPRLSALVGLDVTMADLAGITLGYTIGSLVTLDLDAAGYGWFIDGSPEDNVEFRMRLDEGVVAATPDSAASGRMDLLTVLTHELGHVLGFNHADALSFTVMDDDLEAGVRYLFTDGNSEQTTTPVTKDEFEFADWMWDEDQPSSVRWNSEAGDWEDNGEWNPYAPFQTTRPRKGLAKIGRTVGRLPS
jgi:hypothetical protein